MGSKIRQYTRHVSHPESGSKRNRESPALSRVSQHKHPPKPQKLSFRFRALQRTLPTWPSCCQGALSVEGGASGSFGGFGLTGLMQFRGVRVCQRLDVGAAGLEAGQWAACFRVLGSRTLGNFVVIPAYHHRLHPVQHVRMGKACDQGARSSWTVKLLNHRSQNSILVGSPQGSAATGLSDAASPPLSWHSAFLRPLVAPAEQLGCHRHYAARIQQDSRLLVRH